MDKWFYIMQLSELSSKNNDTLLHMLNYYNKNGLCEITYQEAKRYWKQLNEN